MRRRGKRQAAAWGAGWLIAACIGLLLGIGSAASALASGGGPHRVRVGAEVVAASSARDIGGLAAATRMHVTIVLKVRSAAALARYAREVSTPGSSVYRSYLTRAEFAQRFGATPRQVRAVQASMRAHGLVAGAVAPNRLSIPVTATAAQIERAFSVSFRRKALPRGRVAVIANAAPAFDTAVAGDVQAVLGLSSVSAPKPLLQRPAQPQLKHSRLTFLLAPRAAAGAPTPCPEAQAAAASQGAHTADQIASAYRFSDLYGQGAEGQGQTVAIYELESYDPGDVAAYQSCYGTAASVSNVLVDGGAGSGPGSGEAALDIENAVGLAPKARFIVYEGPNSSQASPGSGPYDTFSAIINQDKAHVISVSWGECEQLQGSNSVGAENTLFEEAAAQGQSIVSATGDNGAEDCNGTNGPDPQQAVDDPGSQPFVTGVGGTTLNAVGPPPSETVWNHGGNASGLLVSQGGAGGGGVSHAWAMPGYQQNSASALNVIGPGSAVGSGCGNSGGYCRQVPDVAADADPATGYIVYWNGSGSDPTSPTGWQAVGGTSAASPLWAALLADADSSSACHGSAIGFANPSLYAAASTGYASSFNDISSGNNDYTGTNGGLYPAGPGYDMASGLGTPNAGALAASLCAGSLRVNNPGTQFGTVARPVRLQITTTALPGARLTYYSSHLPPGLSMSASTGRVTGRPKRIGTWLVGVAARDQNLSLRAAFFTWKVGGPPQISRASLTGLGRHRPILALTINAGRRAPQLRAISLGSSEALSFGRPGRQITVTGTRGRRIPFTAQLVHGRLEIVLAHPRARIRITIRSAALRVTPALTAQVQRRRRPVLTLRVATLDAADEAVGERAHIVPRR